MLKAGVILHNINCKSATGKDNALTVVNMYKSFYEVLSTTVYKVYLDIVEIELMPEGIKCATGTDTIALNVSWKYVVSVLYLKECFYEGVVTLSPCFRYIYQ